MKQVHGMQVFFFFLVSGFPLKRRDLDQAAADEGGPTVGYQEDQWDQTQSCRISCTAHLPPARRPRFHPTAGHDSGGGRRTAGASGTQIKLILVYSHNLQQSFG